MKRVVFIKKEKRDCNGLGCGKVDGYSVRIIGDEKKDITEYWTTETIEKLRRKYRANRIEL